eukprot:1623375-Amphidinium_carterae.2
MRMDANTKSKAHVSTSQYKYKRKCSSLWYFTPDIPQQMKGTVASGGDLDPQLFGVNTDRRTAARSGLPIPAHQGKPRVVNLGPEGDGMT